MALLTSLLGLLVRDIPDASDSAAYTDSNNTSNGSTPLPAPPMAQLLPKDLLKDTRKLSKEEIREAIMNGIKKKVNHLPGLGESSTPQWSLPSQYITIAPPPAW